MFAPFLEEDTYFLLIFLYWGWIQDFTFTSQVSATFTSQVSAWPLYYFLNPMGQKYNLNDRFLIRNHADQKEIKISKGGKNGIIKPAEYS